MTNQSVESDEPSREILKAQAEALEDAQAWVGEFAGPATNMDDAISDVLRSVWQELGYRAHILRERAAPCVAPPGNLCTDTGCWDADRCMVSSPAQATGGDLS